MKRTKSSVMDLTKIMAEMLDEYSEEVYDEAVTTMKDLAPKVVDQVRTRSPKSDNAGDHYANGWVSIESVDKKGTIRFTVYNKDKPTLTHILENGHRGYPLKNGGRTRSVAGIKHIEPSQKWAEKEAEKELERRLKG